MQTTFETVMGMVVQGHQVASRPSRDYPYPTIEKQMPFFKKLGLDLSHCFVGTLNISIAPLEYELVSPEYTFYYVEWTDLHPPETFSFSPCRVLFRGVDYPGMIYFPHPETKIRHYQDPSLIEVLAEKIPEVHYGAEIQLQVDPSQVRIIRK